MSHGRCKVCLWARYDIKKVHSISYLGKLFHAVCHHPPISAFYLESEENGVCLNGHCKFNSPAYLLVFHILFFTQVGKSQNLREQRSRLNKSEELCFTWRTTMSNTSLIIRIYLFVVSWQVHVILNWVVLVQFQAQVGQNQPSSLSQSHGLAAIIIESRAQ